MPGGSGTQAGMGDNFWQSLDGGAGDLKDDEKNLARVELDLKYVEGELQRLLQRQEKLLDERNAIRARLAKVEQQSTSLAQVTNSGSFTQASLERNDFPWSNKLMKLLKDVFGLSELRPFQLPTINALMNRQDCILIMPTGGGKSLCFQLPALMVEGVTLVISPLVSLMEDQVMALKSKGIEAEMLAGNVSMGDLKYINKSMTDRSSKMKILYVTPERLKKSKVFMANLEKMHSIGRLAHFAVDEVHCCSQWGHDFRPDYKLLGILKSQFPNVPILGLTATATTRITIDVQKMLDIERCLVLRASFNRPNLRYKVVNKSSSGKDTIADLVRFIRTNYDGQSGIIYCLSTKESDDLAYQLSVHGISANSYHASLAPNQRSQVHRDWLDNKCQVVVATIAFGMGIDKSDVRFVIHHSMSKSMENFYQESGRAGRDGKTADCIVMFRLNDVFRLSCMVFQDKTGLVNLYSSVAFCIELKRCRRAILADHFGERWQASDCNKMCDNCNVLFAEGGSSSRSETTDVTEHCRALLEVVKNAGNSRKPITGNKLMDIWLYKTEKTLQSKIPPPNFARGECERLFANLLINNYFKERFHYSAYMTISYIVAGPKASGLAASSKIFLEIAPGKRKTPVVAEETSKAASTSRSDGGPSNSQNGKDVWLRKTTAAATRTTDAFKRATPLRGKLSDTTSTTDNNRTPKLACKAKKAVNYMDVDDGFPDDEDLADFESGEWSRTTCPLRNAETPARTSKIVAKTSSVDLRMQQGYIDLTDSSQEQATNNNDESALVADIDWDEDVFDESLSSSMPTKETAAKSSQLKYFSEHSPIETAPTNNASTSKSNESSPNFELSKFVFKKLSTKKPAEKEDSEKMAKRFKL